MKEEKFYCPVNGWDCPYWRKDGTCCIDGIPWEECDDAAAFHDWEEDENEDHIYIFGN